MVHCNCPRPNEKFSEIKLIGFGNQTYIEGMDLHCAILADPCAPIVPLQVTVWTVRPLWGSGGGGAADLRRCWQRTCGGIASVPCSCSTPRGPARSPPTASVRPPCLSRPEVSLKLRPEVSLRCMEPRDSSRSPRGAAARGALGAGVAARPPPALEKRAGSYKGPLRREKNR